MPRNILRMFIMRFVCTLVIVLSFFAAFSYQRIENNQNNVRSLAKESLYHVEIMLDDLFNKTKVLEGFLKSLGEERMLAMTTDEGRGVVALQEFNIIAEKISGKDSIKALQLLPNGITSYSYPLKGNETSLGDRVFEREAVNKAALYAKNTGQIVVDGPIELMQGGLGLIVRNPIYYNSGEFWGFAVIVLSLPNVLEALGLSDLSSKEYVYQFNVYNDANGITIMDTFDRANVDIKDSISSHTYISNKRVELFIAPKDGWFSIHSILFELLFFILISIVIAILLTKNRISSDALIHALEKEKEERLRADEACKIAEKSNQAKSNFLSMMSHDIRTPMNAIVGLCTLLQRDSNNHSKVIYYTNKLTASSQLLLGLINDVLDMSKIESGKFSLNQHDFSLAAIISSINTIVRPQANAKKQSFNIEAHDIKHEIIIGDDLRLNQILLNLLSNAVKYTQNEGSVSFEVYEKKHEQREKSTFVFKVIDNGMGMSEEFIKKIYEPFVRNDNVGNIQGTGLGMSITSRIIKMMGGSIDIQSKLGQGTEVTVSLDFSLPEENIDNIEFFEKVNMKRILLVDDDALFCQGVTKALKDVGVEVVSVANEHLAFNLIDDEKEDFDIYLIDMHIGQYIGADLIHYIKHHPNPNVARTPSFLISAQDFSALEMQYEMDNIGAFLSKPFFVTNFKQAIINYAYSYNHKRAQLQEKKDAQSVALLKAMPVRAFKHCTCEGECQFTNLTPVDNTSIADLSKTINIHSELSLINNKEQLVDRVLNATNECCSNRDDCDGNCLSVLKGMHILAAEDNDLNSEILVELLSMRGAKCTVCKDGLAIVEAFKRSKQFEYNFILMDIQMPNLNGLEATKLIRNSNLPHAKTIPIIAMTANAFSEDIKASLEAGMNYHISKPLDLDILEQRLLEHCPECLYTNRNPNQEQCNCK